MNTRSKRGGGSCSQCKILASQLQIEQEENRKQKEELAILKAAIKDIKEHFDSLQSLQNDSSNLNKMNKIVGNALTNSEPIQQPINHWNDPLGSIEPEPVPSKIRRIEIQPKVFTNPNSDNVNSSQVDSQQQPAILSERNELDYDSPSTLCQVKIEVENEMDTPVEYPVKIEISDGLDTQPSSSFYSVLQYNSVEDETEEEQNFEMDSNNIDQHEGAAETESEENILIKCEPQIIQNNVEEPCQAPATIEELFNSSKIIHKILKVAGQDFTLLNSLRLINLSWIRVACDLLNDRSVVRLYYEKYFRPNFSLKPNSSKGPIYEFGAQNFSAQMFRSYSVKTLKSFNFLLSRTNGFPCISFEFSKGNLADYEVGKFFQSCFIKSLKFEQGASGTHFYTKSARYEELLRAVSQNLEEFSFVDFKGQIGISPSIEFPLLVKISRINGDYKPHPVRPDVSAMDIVRAAPNLQEICDFQRNCKFTKIIRQTGECVVSRIFNKLQVSCESKVDLQDLKQLTESFHFLLDEFKLEYSYTIGENREEIGELLLYLKKLLVISKDSLKSLTLPPFCLESKGCEEMDGIRRNVKFRAELEFLNSVRNISQILKVT